MNFNGFSVSIDSKRKMYKIPYHMGSPSSSFASSIPTVSPTLSASEMGIR